MLFWGIGYCVSVELCVVVGGVAVVADEILAVSASVTDGHHFQAPCS